VSKVAIGTDKKLHYSCDVHDFYTGEYFCPNPACNTMLILKNKGSDTKSKYKVEPYFSALPNKNHVDYCEYKSSSQYNYKELEVVGFVFDDFFNMLLQKNLTESKNKADESASKDFPYLKKENKITTLAKLFNFLLYSKDNESLPTGEKVWQIFQHERNQEIWNNKRKSKRIIKLNFSNFTWKPMRDNSGLEYFSAWCYYPFPTKSKPPALGAYELKFLASDFTLYKYFSEKFRQLHKTNDKIVPIAVLAEWTGTKCWINSKKQIYIFSK